MNNLHEDVVLILFDYLDNKSIWNALQSSKHLATIFSNSSRHQSRFTLKLNADTVNNILKVKDFPAVPIKNVSIESTRHYEFEESYIEKVMKIIKIYKNSIESVELKSFDFYATNDLERILRPLRNIQSLLFENCQLETYNNNQLQKFTLLKSISFHESEDNFFKIFHSQKSIEKISIVRVGWGADFSWVDFDEMVKNFPKLNSLVMKGHGTGNYFEYGGFPFKIRSLDVFLMTFYWTNHLPRIRFLESQKVHLKELWLEKLPYDYDGGAVLKYMIEEMQLETFYNGKIPLILGGKKQDVKEFRVQEVQIQSAFEIFVQFPTITKFSLFLTQTGLDSDEIGQIINPRTTLFANCKELEIEDSSNYETLLSMFTGLYKNFRNIRKLTIITPDLAINSVLEECLPAFTQLSEIYLACRVPNGLQRLQFIRDFTPNVRKLSISEEFVNDAREFFGNDVEIVGI